MDIHKDQLKVIEILRRLNRIFVRIRDTKKLLSELCDTLLTVENFQAIWAMVLARNLEVLEFEHRGFGDYGSNLETRLFSKGITNCIRLAMEKGEPFIVEKEDICQICSLQEYKKNTHTLTIPVYFQKDFLGILTIALKADHKLSELERSMLIDLSEDLGNAINTIQLEKGKEVLFDSINLLTKSVTGNTSRLVLESFLLNLVKSLDSDYAFIGRFVPGYEDRIKTISVSTPERTIDNFEYTLKGTPCEEVITKDICCYTKNVADLFPKDLLLRDMGIVAYIGAPLFNSVNEVIGILVVLKKSPFHSETLARSLFQVFASRASSELMRFDTEQRIIQSENQYKESIEASKNPIYIIVGNQLALVNSAWLEMFEYTEKEVFSPDFSVMQIVAPESHDLFQSRLENFLAGISQPFRYDLKAISKSGRKYDLDVSVTLLNWGGKQAVQGVYRNVTDEKKKEKKLLKALDESHRSAQMKTAFLSNLSHEIHTSLENIKTRGQEVLTEGKEDAGNRSFADYVVKQTGDLLENINDIIDISDMEQGTLSLNPERFNLPDLMKDVIQYFHPLASGKGIKLTCCEKKINTVFVMADPLRVRQVLINIIGNALKFTEKGGINIDYQLRQDDVRISVADTGMGIAPDKQRKIHKSFINPNGSLSGDYDSSGLGLTVTRSLIQLMGGKIWVESNSGGGSVFYFTIPLA